LALGLAGAGGGGFGLGIAAERGWACTGLVDVTTTAGRDAVAGLDCEADDSGALVEAVVVVAALATGAGSGSSFAGALTGGFSGPDSCASAGPLPTPRTPTAAATRSRANRGRVAPAPPSSRIRSASCVTIPQSSRLVEVVLADLGTIVNADRVVQVRALLGGRIRKRVAQIQTARKAK
jgi:hypothetical protein